MSEHRQYKNPQRHSRANIRHSTVKKLTKSKKTGAGDSGELTELDETVLNVLGCESANKEPVVVENLDIVFGEEIIVTTTPSVEGKIYI